MRKEKGKDMMKLSLPPKLLEKLNQFGSLLFRFVKFSFSISCLMAYYAETGRSHPPNRKTLQKIKETLLNA